MASKQLFTAAILVGALGGLVLAQSTDPLIGTWKLNAAKSKGAKSGTSRIEAAGQGVKFVVDVVGTDGAVSHWEFTANYDGKDYPVKGNSPYGDVVSLSRVDARTIRITSKHGGKPGTVSTIVLSPDGKTRTTTTKGVNTKGEPVDVVSFYEKQ